MSDDAKSCNLCGLSLLLDDPDGGTPHGLVEASVSGSYASTPGNGGGALDDTTSYHFSLCEWCCDWIFSVCANPPRLTDYMRDDAPKEEAFRPAAQRVAEDEWRRMKAKFFAEKKRRDGARAQVMSRRERPSS